jgi:Zn-dependent M28 family amino/carboxypeptidase
VATLLEIATRLGADPSVHNMMVRFAFFGGEESGAQGSSAYLEGDVEATGPAGWPPSVR